MVEKIYKFTKGEGYEKANGRPFLSTYRKRESELTATEKDLLFGELINAWDNTPDEIKNKFLMYLSHEFEKVFHNSKFDDAIDLAIKDLNLLGRIKPENDEQ